MNEYAVLCQVAGTALRYHRERLGLALNDVADVLKCDRSKVSRIETGKRGIRPRDLERLLDEYAIGGQERDTLLALAPVRCRSDSHWWQRDGDGYRIPNGFRSYLLLESHATSITVYSPLYVPGLLQTPHYATVLGGATGSMPTDMAEAFTVARQKAIREDRQRCLAVILGEAALYQQVGNAEVMRKQITRLAATTDRISLHLLPFTARPHPCLGSGSVTLLRYAAAPYLDTVHLDGPGGGICLTRGQDVARYVDALQHAKSAALAPSDTARLLGQMTEPNRWGIQALLSAGWEEEGLNGET